ncbi:hypothetical protein [Methylobacterium platani]|uniref:Uncharacterized protein n=1 Tax=Methylobacterium platani TaxID=427683 RepID=A0A179SIF1_9HYPH|nr:hypothetical protein [Methylobacterium platani]OAS26304.1 hypothetical protein A5481_06205 [Methylobacterium platani]
MTTEILSNGSGSVQPLEALFARLESDTLDRSFEAYGNFVEECSNGMTSFFGNFLTYSHVFNVMTDDADLIERLTAAIRRNQQSADYLDQTLPFDCNLLTIERKRFSVTQGEVLLTYAGRSLGQFGDKIELTGGGVWRGHGDREWEDTARKILAREHAAAREVFKAAQAVLPSTRVAEIFAAQKAAPFGADLDATMSAEEARAVRAVQMHPSSAGSATFRSVLTALGAARG